MEFKKTKEAARYQELKQWTDNAEKMYHATMNASAWEAFVSLEIATAEYAMENESEIWNDE